MKNENLVKSWIEFSDMDASLADFTFHNMNPKPLELICYHCQQAAEKSLKALAIATLENSDVPKTHDLALLADMLNEQNFIKNMKADILANKITLRIIL